MIKKAVTCFLSTPAFFPRVCSCKASAWRKEIVIYTQIFPFLNPYLPDFLTPKIPKTCRQWYIPISLLLRSTPTSGLYSEFSGTVFGCTQLL